MSRKKDELWLIANWKLNKGNLQTLAFLEEIKSSFKDESGLVCAIAPSHIALDIAKKNAPKGLKICAQNVFYEPSGAFTGEISSLQLKELGVDFCLVGHSERRNLFHETSFEVAKKAKACLNFSINPIICIGETLSERKNGLLEKVLDEQLGPIFEETKAFLFDPIIAYEPVWAIGTGVSASIKEVEDAQRLILEIIDKLAGQEYKNRSKILYGGSVTTSNIEGFLENSYVDGVLVGGYSLQSLNFLAMMDKLKKILGKK